MEELEIRMRDVLLQLALTSNGRTASMDASHASEPDYTPTFSTGDAPHLRFAEWWDSAQDDAERERCYEAAAATLRDLRHSRGDRKAGETLVELKKRIVDRWEGIPAAEVAIRVRCGISIVWAARKEANRDRDHGRQARTGPQLSREQRQAEIERLTSEGMSPAQIAHRLGIHANTVRRAIGTKR